MRTTLGSSVAQNTDKEHFYATVFHSGMERATLLTRPICPTALSWYILHTSRSRPLGLFGTYMILGSVCSPFVLVHTPTCQNFAYLVFLGWFPVHPVDIVTCVLVVDVTQVMHKHVNYPQTARTNPARNTTPEQIGEQLPGKPGLRTLLTGGIYSGYSGYSLIQSCDMRTLVECFSKTHRDCSRAIDSHPPCLR